MNQSDFAMSTIKLKHTCYIYSTTHIATNLPHATCEHSIQACIVNEFTKIYIYALAPYVLSRVNNV